MQTPKAEPATKLQEQTECQLEIRPEKLAASTSSSASCDRSVFHLATLPHMRCFQVVAINTPTTLQLLFTAIQSNCLFFFLLLCFSRLPPSLFQTLFFHSIYVSIFLFLHFTIQTSFKRGGGEEVSVR